jgi:hypothetical protein
VTIQLEQHELVPWGDLRTAAKQQTARNLSRRSQVSRARSTVTTVVAACQQQPFRPAKMRALPVITANNQSAIFTALLAGALCSKHMSRNDDQKAKAVTCC